MPLGYQDQADERDNRDIPAIDYAKGEAKRQRVQLQGVQAGTIGTRFFTAGPVSNAPFS